MQKQKYTCSKCGNKKADIDKIRTTGAGFTRYFNIQNRRFTVVSCTVCGYAEFYREDRTGGASNILDFLTN